MARRRVLELCRLRRGVGWPSFRRCLSFCEQPLGRFQESIPGCIVTNLALPSRAVVRFHNQRGTAEPWIKEGKLAVNWTRHSCHISRTNAVRPWLSAIAYNCGNLWRRLASPRRFGNWSLTGLQQHWVKTGERRVKTARYDWLLLAKEHQSGKLPANMLRMIVALPLPDG